MTRRFSILMVVVVVLASCSARPTLVLETTEPEVTSDINTDDAQPESNAAEPTAEVAGEPETEDELNVDELFELPDELDDVLAEYEVGTETIVVELAETTNVYDTAGGEVIEELEATTAFGATTTLPVIEDGEDWLHVVLPGRPNGRTGWIQADGLAFSSVSHRVEVNLTNKTLELYDGDTLVLHTSVAIGAPDNPTPTGTTFITDLLRTSDAGSAYGPFAYGLGFRSDQLTEFAGGDGQIGLHGTNDPTSIGQAVSSGCVRAPNEVMAALAEILPLGTPVVITA